MRDTLATVSIRQPWAWAIMAGRKTVEIRSRPVKYRGQMLIHAAKSQQDWWQIDDMLADDPPDFEPVLYFGCLLGVVNLIDCRLLSDRSFGLVLDNPRPIDPVEANGHLALPYYTPLVPLVSLYPDLDWLRTLP